MQARAARFLPSRRNYRPRVPYCTNCGEEVTDEQRYCSYCGEPVGDHESREGPGGGGGGHSRRGDDQRPQDDDSTDWGAGSQRAPAGQAADQPGTEPNPYEQAPETELLPSRGTFETYYDSLRESTRLPAVLGLLFVAWALTGLPAILPPGAVLAVTLGSAVLGLLGAAVAYVVTDYGYRDEPVSTMDAVRRTASRAIPLAGVWLVFTIVFSVGLSLFVLPGLYFGGRLLLAFPACVLDGEGAIDSLRTSWELTTGDSLKPMGFLVAAFVLVIVISIALAVPQAIVFDALNVGVDDAATVDELLELAADPQFAAVNSLFTGLTFALPIAAVQVAAAHMYLENRYGVRKQPR